jgi:hypothetical protein
VINDMVERLKKLGPLDLPRQFEQWDQEVASLQHKANQQEGTAHA